MAVMGANPGRNMLRRYEISRLRDKSVPLQEKEFGAEAGAEGGGECDVALFGGTFFEPLLQNKENRGAGKISNVAQNVPGRLGIALAAAEIFLYFPQQTRAAGMENPAADLFARHAVAGKKTV